MVVQAPRIASEAWADPVLPCRADTAVDPRWAIRGLNRAVVLVVEIDRNDDQGAGRQAHTPHRRRHNIVQILPGIGHAQGWKLLRDAS